NRLRLRAARFSDEPLPFRDAQSIPDYAAPERIDECLHQPLPPHRGSVEVPPGSLPSVPSGFGNDSPTRVTKSPLRATYRARKSIAKAAVFSIVRWRRANCRYFSHEFVRVLTVSPHQAGKYR